MSKNQLPCTPLTQVQLLQAKIDALYLEINKITQETTTFENLLRTKIEDELIEEQELTLLYKQQKKEKKAQRSAQKKSGKNYQQTETIIPTKSKPISQKNVLEQGLKKQLYREAMLHVHPDKFSMQTEKLDLATEITTQLIEIYQSGDLASLQAYHAHIFSGNTALKPMDLHKPSKIPELTYLQMEYKRLGGALREAKNKQTYKVLTEYENPMSFLDELKAYYKDRLLKLRKRTRFK